MTVANDKARLLQQLAARPDLTEAERDALREAAERFRASDSRPTRASRRALRARDSATETTSLPATLDDAVILWSDGAARGNPGPAGAGAILKKPNGELLAECSEYLGHTTNNIAEYKALLLGLERALELGVRRIEVRADSELLIKQLRGQYRVRHENLKPLFETAKQLLDRFDATRLTHVRREQNGEADRLANAGIDSR